MNVERRQVPPTQDQARRLRLWVSLYRLPESKFKFKLAYNELRGFHIDFSNERVPHKFAVRVTSDLHFKMTIFFNVEYLENGTR